MASMIFTVGQAYYANPVIKGGKQRIVACTGRRGRYVMFSRVDLMDRCEVRAIDGREIGFIRADDGHELCVSSASRINMDDLASVLACLER